MLQDNCLSPHYLKHILFQHHMHPTEEQLPQLGCPGEYTEELSLYRAVCKTSVINWILPREDFVEFFFLLFLRLDHLRSNLLEAPFYEQLQMLREIKHFPPFPIITQWFFSPQFYHSILSKTPILTFCLWAEKLFSPCLLPPAICFFYFLRTGERVISPGWQTSSLASFHCVSFGYHLGVWKGFVDLSFFPPGRWRERWQSLIKVIPFV